MFDFGSDIDSFGDDLAESDFFGESEATTLLSDEEFGGQSSVFDEQGSMFDGQESEDPSLDLYQGDIDSFDDFGDEATTSMFNGGGYASEKIGRSDSDIIRLCPDPKPEKIVPMPSSIKDNPSFGPNNYIRAQFVQCSHINYGPTKRKTMSIFTFVCSLSKRTFEVTVFRKVNSKYLVPTSICYITGTKVNLYKGKVNLLAIEKSFVLLFEEFNPRNKLIAPPLSMFSRPCDGMLNLGELNTRYILRKTLEEESKAYQDKIKKTYGKTALVGWLLYFSPLHRVSDDKRGLIYCVNLVVGDSSKNQISVRLTGPSALLFYGLPIDFTSKPFGTKSTFRMHELVLIFGLSVYFPLNPFMLRESFPGETVKCWCSSLESGHNSRVYGKEMHVLATETYRSRQVVPRNNISNVSSSGFGGDILSIICGGGGGEGGATVSQEDIQRNELFPTFFNTIGGYDPSLENYVRNGLIEQQCSDTMDWASIERTLLGFIHSQSNNVYNGPTSSVSSSSSQKFNLLVKGHIVGVVDFLSSGKCPQCFKRCKTSFDFEDGGAPFLVKECFNDLHKHTLPNCKREAMCKIIIRDEEQKEHKVTVYQKKIPNVLSFCNDENLPTMDGSTTTDITVLEPFILEKIIESALSNMGDKTRLFLVKFSEKKQNFGYGGGDHHHSTTKRKNNEGILENMYDLVLCNISECGGGGGGGL